MHTPPGKFKLTVYISTLVYKALRKEVIRRGAHHGDQSEIVEEALREKLGLPPTRKERRIVDEPGDCDPR